MHFYIGLSVAVIMLLSFAYFIAALRSNTRANATQMAVEQVKGYSFQLQKITNQALGFSESLASSVAYMFDKRMVNREDLIKLLLQNSAANNQAYKCIWVSLEHSAITSGYTKQSGRRSYLSVPFSNIPVMVVDKDTASFDPNSLYYQVKNSGKPDVKDPYFYNYYNSSSEQLLITTLGCPVVYNGQAKGVAGVDIALDEYQKVVDNVRIFPGTSAFLVSQSGFVAAHSNKLMVGKSYESTIEGKRTELALGTILSSNDITQTFTEIGGKSYFVVVAPIPMGDRGTRWVLGVVIPSSEIFAQSRKSVFIAILVCLLGLVITYFAINYLAKSIAKPLGDVTSSIKLLASGAVNKSKLLNVNTGDEMQEIAGSLNVLVDGLNRTALFAQEIGRGNLSVSHKLLGENDIIGASLEEMRSSLIKAKEAEEMRRVEEEKNHWANQGYAEFSGLLRQNGNNVKELSFSVVSNLVKYLGLVQGGMFILNETDQSDRYLEMVACFAYNRRKLMSRRFELGEGLVGRCFDEAETIYLLEIPDGYISITSGLGDAKPKCLLLVPLKVNSEVNGVIELASLSPIEEYKVKFVEKVAESIASTMASVRVNVHTAELLERTQQQAEEMAAQEEEMRQNLEELQSTQDEMLRIHSEQLKMQDKLALEQNLLRNLLDSTQEVIYFKGLDGRYIKASRAKLAMHGFTSEEQIIGKSDRELYGDKFDVSFENEEKEIIRTGKGVVDILEKVEGADGSVTWLSVSKLPIFDKEGGVVGIWISYHDVTKMVLLEEKVSRLAASEGNLLH